MRKMSDKELVDKIHPCLSGSDKREGISRCFDLATDQPHRAANIFAAYRPEIIDALHGWAREVNGHQGVFLPHSLFRSEAPGTFEAMREFENQHGSIIDSQAQASPKVREHVDAANSMETERHAIAEAIESWRADRERRKLCGTSDPEHLAQIETSTVEIAVDIVKKVLKDGGYKVSNVDPKKINDKAIKLVKENPKILEEALRRERQLNKLNTPRFQIP